MKLKLTTKNKFCFCIIGINYSGLISLSLVIFSALIVKDLPTAHIHKPGSQYLTYAYIVITILLTFFHIYKVIYVLRITNNCKLVESTLKSYDKYYDKNNLGPTYHCKYEFTVCNIKYITNKSTKKPLQMEWVAYNLDTPKRNFILSTIPSVSGYKTYELNKLN